ncbi:hypothetical protein FKM82_016722 [Ascaphus truei]
MPQLCLKQNDAVRQNTLFSALVHRQSLFYYSRIICSVSLLDVSFSFPSSLCSLMIFISMLSMFIYSVLLLYTILLIYP